MFLLSTQAWDPATIPINAGCNQWSLLASDLKHDGSVWWWRCLEPTMRLPGLAEGWVTRLWHGDQDSSTQNWDKLSWAWRLLLFLKAPGSQQCELEVSVSGRSPGAERGGRPDIWLLPCSGGWGEPVEQHLCTTARSGLKRAGHFQHANNSYFVLLSYALKYKWAQ